MMMFVAVFAASTLVTVHRPTIMHPIENATRVLARPLRPIGPAASSVDTASQAVYVRGVRPGARVDAYANGVWLGAAIARGGLVRVPLRYHLAPGMRVVTNIRTPGRAAMSLSTGPTQVDYTTYHFDDLRTGWNPYEAQLNTATVSGPAFGLLYSLPVDGNVYAQPLYVSNLTMPDNTVHNVLYVATCNDTLYAFDADTGATLWVDAFANPSAGIYAPSSMNFASRNIRPTVGIVSTPAIDRGLNAIFLVTDLKVGGTGGSIHLQLHSIALDTGAENANSPVEINGSTQMSDGSTALLDEHWQYSRAGLLVNDGNVYIGLSSHSDNQPLIARGWVVGYDEMSLQQSGIFSTERDVSTYKYLATIWAGGYGIAGDANGNVYFATGNGAMDMDSDGDDFGNSVIKLGPDLSLEDFFTPYQLWTLQQKDKDLGSGGVMLLPDQPGSVPHLAVVVGKSRNLWVMNRDHLGEFSSSGKDANLQTLKNAVGINKGVHGGPAYYAGPTGQFVFYAGNADYLKAFELTGVASAPLVLAGESTNTFPGEGGSIPAVSSNGTTPGTGIVWVTTRPSDVLNTPLTLRAYDASNVANMLFEAPFGNWLNQNGNPDLTPTVMNGRVYLGTGNSVAVFGAL